MSEVHFRVVEADLDKNPGSFLESCKKSFCEHPAHLVVGVDIDKSKERFPETKNWISQLHKTIENEINDTKPETLPFVSTIFALAWPQLPIQDIEMLFEVGAYYRQKDKQFYSHEPGDIAESLRNDLICHELIPKDGVMSCPEPDAPPAKPEEDDSFKQRMQIYADPPFSLPEETMRKLFQEEKLLSSWPEEMTRKLLLEKSAAQIGTNLKTSL